jgi:ADP-heptose:LPS heptosyltransferase
VSATRPTLLVLRALGLGDLLTGLPALRALAEAFPRHRRLLAAPRALAPLARLGGAVDEVMDVTGLAPLPAAPPPDVAVNLHGPGLQSHQVLLAAQPRRLVAFQHAEIPQTRGAPRWRADEHEVERWCRLLVEHGIAADPTRLELTPPVAPVPPGAVGATLIHPGAASAARRWPADRWAAVAHAERAAGRPVIVTGGAGEIPLARAVARRAGLEAGAVQAGTDLEQLTALVAAAARVVVGDTGIAHLATALGTPSVVLFGPTPPALWGPPPLRRRHRALWAGRSGDPHGATIDPGLLAISVGEVLEALAGLERTLAGAAA